jgi:hypothetical protein
MNQTGETRKPRMALKKQKKHEITKGLSLRAPYSDWDVKKVLIDSPIELKSQDNKATYYTSQIYYEYTLENGKTEKGPLKIEIYNDKIEGIDSDYGLKETLESLTPDEELAKKSGIEINRKGTGKFKIYAKLDPNNQNCSKIREIMNDIFILCLHYMKDNGSSKGGKNSKAGKGFYKDKSYNLPELEEGDKYDHNTLCDHLMHPIWYAERTDMQGASVIKVKDDKIPSTIGMHVITKGRNQSNFCDINGNDIPYHLLIGQGIRHVPMMVVKELTTAGLKPKIKSVLDSSIVVKKLSSKQVEQKETADLLRQNGLDALDAMRSEALLNFEDSDEDPMNGPYSNYNKNEKMPQKENADVTKST